MSLRMCAWALVVLAAVALVACDDKDVGSAAENGTVTTAAVGADPSPTSALPYVSTSTTIPIDFDAAVAEIKDALHDAEGDLCALVDVTARPLNVAPQTEEQAQVVVDMIVGMVESMGRVAEPSDTKIYQEAAARLEDQAEAKDYSPEWLSSEMYKALDDPDFFKASGRLQARYQAQCPQATTGN